MAQKIGIIVYPAKDLAAAKPIFTKFLGTEPYADSAYYVGYKVGDLEVGLAPQNDAVIGYIEVDDIKASLQSFVELGAQIHQDITDVGGGLLIAQIKEPNGNVLGFRQQP